MFKPKDDELTLKECAVRLGVTHEAVRLRVKNGDLPAQKRGRSYYVKKVDLDRFIQENTQ